MNHVHVWSLPAHNNVVKVLWSTGIQRQGAIEVEFDAHIDDIEAAAELCAIRRLIFDRRITGNSVHSSKGLVLHLARGAIRKLALGKSTKKHLLQYCGFFRGPLRGVEIEVMKRKNAFIPPETQPTEERISAQPIYHESVDTAFGRVIVTEHALERFAEHVYEGCPERLFSSLSGRLQNPDLAVVELPEKVRAHKLRKYPGQRQPLVLRHPTDVVHFVLVEDGPGLMALVTVFVRTENNVPTHRPLQRI